MATSTGISTGVFGITDPAWTYSLTFTAYVESGNTLTTETKNTYTDWKLIAEAPPTVPSPTPITNFISIPGHPAGGIDLSLEPWGKMMYNRVTGSWNFLMVTDNKETRRSKFDEIRRWLHGRTCMVQLMENSNRYHEGFFTVAGDHAGVNTYRITIGFNLSPVRYTNKGKKDNDFVKAWTTQILPSGTTGSTIPGGNGSGGLVWNGSLIPNVQELEGYLIYLNPSTGHITYAGGLSTDADLTEDGRLLFAATDDSGYDLTIDENGHGIQYEDSDILG